MRFSASAFALLLLAACTGERSQTTFAVPDAPTQKVDVDAGPDGVTLLLRTPSADRGDRGGQTVDLDAAIVNPQGHELEHKRHTGWASRDTMIATVDSTGLVTAQDTGDVWIVVEHKKAADSVYVRVRPVPVRFVAVTGPDSVSVRDVEQYSATPQDSEHVALVGRVVTWHSSDGQVLTVSATGSATAIAEGTAQMEATSEEVTGRLAVKVWPARVATVTVSPSPASVALYRPLTLTATLKDRHGFVLTDRAVTWTSSDAGVFTIAASGAVTTVAPGAAIATAESEGVSGTSAVTVTNPVEARALWVTRFEYTVGNAAIRDSIVKIMQRAGQARFNIVYFQVRGAGDAYYESSIEPCSPRRCKVLGGPKPNPFFDPLAIAVEEAAKYGIQVHAWLNSMTEWIAGSATACSQLVDSSAKYGTPKHMRFSNPSWQMVTSNGATQPCRATPEPEYTWVSPGIPDVRSRLARVAADIARRYGVAGIHLDRIRYPGTTVSYDLPSKQTYALTHNGAFPTSNSSPGWGDLRRSFVTAAVREVRDSIRAVNPQLVLSAAIWPIYKPLLQYGWNPNSSKGYDDYFQDPAAWVAEGTLDVGAPMTYPGTSTSTTYTIMTPECSYLDWTCLLTDQKKRLETDGHRHMYIGVGAIKGQTETLAQIAKGRERGVTGFAVYSYQQVNSWNGWTVLANGPFKYPASIPAMNWK